MNRRGPYDDTPKPDPWTFWMFGIKYPHSVNVFLVGNATVAEIDAVITELHKIREKVKCPVIQKSSPVHFEQSFLL